VGLWGVVERHSSMPQDCVLGVQKQNATLKTIHHFQYIANTEL